jgi:hypothetical protein
MITMHFTAQHLPYIWSDENEEFQKEIVYVRMDCNCFIGNLCMCQGIFCDSI